MTEARTEDPFQGRSIQRATPIREQVADMIRDAITSQAFKPGEVLVERELCEATGASRTTVREALRQLETEGFIVSELGRGSIVIELDVEDALNIYEIRGALEGLAGRLFVEKASDENIEELADVVADIERNSLDVNAVLAAKRRFYDVLFEGAQNPELTKMIGLIHRRITLLRSMSMSYPGRIDSSIDELNEIVSAAKRRDADAVLALCIAHVNAAAEAALKGLDHRRRVNS